VTINNLCRNKTVEKQKPDLFLKVRELKNAWKDKLKQEEMKAAEEPEGLKEDNSQSKGLAPSSSDLNLDYGGNRLSTR